MTALGLFLICLAICLAVGTAEVFLPSGGVLGVIAVLAAFVGLVALFLINEWLGLGVLVGGLAVAPFALNAGVKLWKKTPVGRQVVLRPVDATVARPPVAVGQAGVAASELRPMGLAEFNGERLEVATEIGMIAAGARVRVVGFENNRPVVAEMRDA